MSFFSQFLITKIFGFKSKFAKANLFATQSMFINDLIKKKNEYYKIPIVDKTFTDTEFVKEYNRYELSIALNNCSPYFPEQLIISYLWQYGTLKKWNYKDSIIINDINWDKNSLYWQSLKIPELVSRNDKDFYNMPIKTLEEKDLNNFKNYLIARLNYHFDDEKLLMLAPLNYPKDDNRDLMYEYLYDEAFKYIKNVFKLK